MSNRKKPLASDEWRKSPGKKDTYRWCRGKVGVEHQIEVVREKSGYHPTNCGPAPEWAIRLWGRRWRCWHQYRCSACGKIMGDLDPARCPDRGLLI